MYSTNNHPIIPTPPSTVRDTVDTNVDTFFATISSSDRNVERYPQASSFTVQLPQDYNNITSISLHQSFIPNVSIDFTLEKNNVDLVFKFTGIEVVSNGTDLEQMIYVFVKQFIANNNYFRIRITDGSYTQTQLTLEVQNRMNQIVTTAILDYYTYNVLPTSQTTYTWGDYIYSPTSETTMDGHKIMIHPKYDTFQDALNAYNSITGQIVLLELDILNDYAIIYGSALTPPPLLAIPTVTSTTDLFLGAGSFDAIINNFPGQYSDPSLALGYYSTQVSTLLNAQGGYNHFKVFYDEVQKKAIFGNNISKFEIVMDFEKYYSENALIAANILYLPTETSTCRNTCNNSKSTHANYVNWGLPTYLGFSGKEKTIEYKPKSPLPTFYYYDKNTSPDMYNPFKHETTNGFQELSIYTMTPCNQLNVEGDAYYYMEIDGLNMIDELLPYKNDAYAVTNGTTTGIINSIFAKRLILSLPRGNLYKEGDGEVKTFTPPLRRINKASIRIRYHDGREPYFGTIPLEFTLKIVCQKNQLNRSSNPGFAAPA